MKKTFSCFKPQKLIFSLEKRLIEGFFGVLHFSWRATKNKYLKPSWLLLMAVFLLLLSLTETTTLATQVSRQTLFKTLLEDDIIIETGFPFEEAPNNQDEFQVAMLKDDQGNDDSLSGNNNGIEIIGSLGALVSPETELEGTVTRTRTKIETYVIQPNDTVSSIAERFGLQWSTILWENSLNYWSIIQPGKELKILPVDGLSHKVKKGETLSTIAKKYKSDAKEIAKINGIEESSNLEIGVHLIVPSGTPPPPPPQPRRIIKPVYVKEAGNCTYSNWRRYQCVSACARYYRYPGQCTDWAAYKWATEQGQCVPSGWGNARTWLGNSKRDGYKTALTPVKGSIVVLWCNNWYKHVAYIEDFDSNYIYFSEMNGPAGTGVKDIRKLKRTTEWQKSQGWWKIVGYIYPK